MRFSSAPNMPIDPNSAGLSRTSPRKGQRKDARQEAQTKPAQRAAMLESVSGKVRKRQRLSAPLFNQPNKYAGSREAGRSGEVSVSLSMFAKDAAAWR